MTGAEHRAEAEKLVQSGLDHFENTAAERAEFLAAALVHATLALSEPGRVRRRSGLSA